MGFPSKHTLPLVTMLYLTFLLPTLVLGTGQRDFAQKNSPYSDVCGVDEEEVLYFPASSDRRRLWFSDSTAAQQVLVVTQNGKPGETIRYLQENTNNDEDAFPLYRCPCGFIEQEDELNQISAMYSYCPLEFTCTYYKGKNEPATCVKVPFINNFAHMAWPILLVTMACLVGVLVLSMHGLAFVKYLRKHCVCYGFCPAKTPEEMQEGESREVDELMAVARMDPPPPKPSRFRIFHFQNWQYQEHIIHFARDGWLREWNIYRREQAQQLRQGPRETIQKELFLKTKIYGTGVNTGLDGSISNTSRTADEEEFDELRTNSSSSDGSSRTATGEGANNASFVCESAVPSMSCSICICEIEAGQRVGNLACKHTFHSACLKTWIQTGIRNTCPLCQAPDIARPASSSDDLSSEERDVISV